ncbi:hypothetical protein GCM10010430_73000 [Kitasatospora cystarginea]|uniref:Uncharacterized protein n=1 Tax=Kitasatospora cystarginea TaxID=58350 RepID=A0ABP5RUN4_9ACTN
MLGIIGAVAKGLLYLLFIGVAVLILALAVSAVRLRRVSRRRTR